jgi:hypothetical protein
MGMLGWTGGVGFRVGDGTDGRTDEVELFACRDFWNCYVLASLPGGRLLLAVGGFSEGGGGSEEPLLKNRIGSPGQLQDFCECRDARLPGTWRVVLCAAGLVDAPGVCSSQEAAWLGRLVRISTTMLPGRL